MDPLLCRVILLHRKSGWPWIAHLTEMDQAVLETATNNYVEDFKAIIELVKKEKQTVAQWYAHAEQLLSVSVDLS